MIQIVTLTINPALDKSAKVDGLVPDHKLKCHTIKYQPGGGGINISRVLKRLRIATHCIFPSGGNAGVHLKDLLLKESIEPITVLVTRCTRENLSAVDTQT